VPTNVIKMPGSYPHGIALHEGIDRILVASCVAPDFSGTGNTVEVIEASTNKHIGSVVISDIKGAAPVETVFVPKADPPTAYVTNMMEDTLWALTWDVSSETFKARKVFDFGAIGAHMPLEIYFNKAVDRLYVTTADPGMLHVLNISAGLLEPVLIQSLPTAGGAHHVAFSPSEERAYVQNALLNLPGMNDGSITVINLRKLEVEGTIQTFKERGLVPNSITMLPEWYHPAGHFNNGPYPD
jgi:DNA-binding beta-propeller fold protein YncE